MARVEVFHFEYFDEVRKRWVRARYVATKDVIAARYAQHRLVGEPQIRELPDVPDFGMGYGPAKD